LIDTVNITQLDQRKIVQITEIVVKVKFY